MYLKSKHVCRLQHFNASTVCGASVSVAAAAAADEFRLLLTKLQQNNNALKIQHLKYNIQHTKVIFISFQPNLFVTVAKKKKTKYKPRLGNL